MAPLKDFTTKEPKVMSFVPSWWGFCGHGPYHDKEYGFPLDSDAELFERLMLEINQAGLSWLTILKKREAFRRAYGGFDPEVVAAYGARDRKRLLGDAGIIRNRLKVDVQSCPVYPVILRRHPAWSR
jgi:DNA-3-methyladenine glycosylase I